MSFHLEKELIERVFQNTAVAIGETLGKNQQKKVCRNKHLLFDIEGRKIIVKTFREEESGRKEREAYEFFGSNSLIAVPTVHYADNKYLITDFIQPGEFDVLLTVKDWANIHLSSQGRRQKGVDTYPHAREVEEVLGREELFKKLTKKLEKRLKDLPNSSALAITHGDLYCNNVLTNRGLNYYIDFEKWGLRNPLSDLGLLLFNHSEKAEQIKKLYSETANLSYDADKEINTFWALRLARVVVGLARDKHLPSEFRKHYSKKAITQLEKILI